MSVIAAAVDIGTSGIRGQLLDLGEKKIVRTCVTSRNPIPGANVMDHMSFAIEHGLDLAHGILVAEVINVLKRLTGEHIDRLAVCGNPIQLSLFEGLDIRDLAYAGENKLKEEGIKPVDRRGHVFDGGKIGLPGTEVIVPPAVRHEIGADALAMMLKSGFLDDDMCMVTDYGTNAEMALKVGDNIYTGSAAAGPALEGQHIRHGMIAGPGAMCDLVRNPRGWTMKVLDGDLIPRDGPLVNLRSDMVRREGLEPSGLTGTGVVALMHAAMSDDRVEDSQIRGGTISLGRRLDFSISDFKEAGKAIGAIRAGHMTLLIEAGVDPQQIRTMYMAGATGTYVDPVKAKRMGLITPDCTRVVQVGNTSLELAKDLAFDPSILDELNVLRDKLVTKHIMFASSDVFRDLYLYEFGYWNDGMPLNRYRRALERYGLDGYMDRYADMEVEKTADRDIKDIGKSIEIIDVDTHLTASWKCTGCMSCVRRCPEKALSLEDGVFRINTGSCLGTACQKCVETCPEKVYDYSKFTLDGC